MNIASAKIARFPPCAKSCRRIICAVMPAGSIHGGHVWQWCPSLFSQSLLVGGIASAGYIDRVEVCADVGQLVGGKCYVGRTYVFGYPFDVLRPGDWHYPRLLCQQPSEGGACRGGMFALGESLDIFDQHHIVPEVVRPEAGDGRCVPMSFSSCLLMFGMFLRWCEVSPACRRCV